MEPKDKPSLNDWYRNGGDPVEDREWSGHDVVTQMKRAAQNQAVMHNDLRRWGYDPYGVYGDDYPDPEP